MSNPDIARTYYRGKLAPWCYPTDPRHPYYKGGKMGLYDKLGLDPDMDENDFTVADAARVFEKAANDMRHPDTAINTVSELLKVAFQILKTVAGA